MRAHSSSRSNTRVTRSRPPRRRIDEALAALASSHERTRERPSVASFCRLADVSRNTLYRYYPDTVAAVRRLARRRGGGHSRNRDTLRALRSELEALRAQLARLATLADYYHTAAVEARALLARRERELASLRARERPALMRVRP